MEIHTIDQSGKTSEYKQMPASLEKKIEDFIEKNPNILEKELKIIGRQVETNDGAIVDLIGLDKKGNVTIIELKKDQAPRRVVAQILEYGVWAEEELKYDDLNQIAKRKHILNHNSLMELFIDWTGEIDPEFNQNQKLYVVAENIDQKTEKLARYLRRNGIDIYCVELNFFEKDQQQLVHKRIVVGKEKISSKRDVEGAYTENTHLDKGNQETKEIYNKLKSQVLKLGPNIRINPVKNYIGFVRNGNFLAVKVRKSFLRITLVTQTGFKDPKGISKQQQADHYGEDYEL